MRKRFAKYGYIFFSIVLFCLIFAVTTAAQNARKEVYPVVCLGDSMLGNERGETSITALLEEKLSVPVYNGAFGGTSLSCRNEENRAADPIDSLSMVRIAQSIAANDFSIPNADAARNDIRNQFPESVEAIYGLQDIDFEQVQVLVITHGVNDYLAKIPLENPKDPYDVYSFGGALRVVLESLQRSYPDMKVVLTTPTFCWMLYLESDCTQVNYGCGVLEDYVDLELQIAAEYGVDVVDHYHESGIGDSGTFEEWETFTIDGLHLNENGRELVAGRIAEHIADYVKGAE